MKTISLHTLITVILFAVSPPLFAQKTDALHFSTPQRAGLSDKRIQQIDAVLKSTVERGELPGVVALIAKNGHIVYHQAHGIANPTTEKLLQKEDIFRIASQTKAITSTAVMMLWEEGLFQLDDPISNYIPSFKNPKVLQQFHYRDTTYSARPASREITIRDLLTHTSGLGYGVIDGDERMRLLYDKAGTTDLFTTEPIELAKVVDLIASLPLHHDPGQRYTYSLGLDVLGRLVEVLSGMSFDQFLKTRLFDPLGMKDTYFYLPDDKAARLVDVQYKLHNQWATYPTTFYDPNYPIKGAKTFFSGGAGLSSTVLDYAIFLQMYLNGGTYNGARILSPKTIETIMANQTGELYGGKEQYYGLAFGVAREGAVAKGGMFSEGTFTWGGYFNTQYFADPKEKLVFVLFKQTQGGVHDETTWKLKQLISGAIEQ